MSDIVVSAFLTTLVRRAARYAGTAPRPGARIDRESGQFSSSNAISANSYREGWHRLPPQARDKPEWRPPSRPVRRLSLYAFSSGRIYTGINASAVTRGTVRHLTPSPPPRLGRTRLSIASTNRTDALFLPNEAVHTDPAMPPPPLLCTWKRLTQCLRYTLPWPVLFCVDLCVGSNPKYNLQRSRP